MSEAYRAAQGAAAAKLAVDGAAAAILGSLFPSQIALVRAIATEPSGAVSRASYQLGQGIGLAALDARKEDGSTTSIPYVPQEGPGQWRRTPPALRPPELPQWGAVRPFALKDVDSFLPPAPPALDSAPYIAALNEIQSIGSATPKSRSAWQTKTAQFWSDFSYTASPPGHWNEMLCQIAEDRELQLAETIQLMARMNTAMADAAIVCWRAKYRYHFWRPVTALRVNSISTEEPWKPFLPTPPHPEYVSGHSSFSGAAAAVLEHHFGTDNLSFTARSDTVPETRNYRSLKACAEEISASRVFAGIHFSFSCQAGLALGRHVAHSQAGLA